MMLPYPPSANRYWRIARNRLYPSKEAVAFKATVAKIYRESGVERINGQVCISIGLHPRVNRNGDESKVRLDLDNALKVTLDALNGIAYKDDANIVLLKASLGVGIPGGGVSVAVMPA